MGKTKKRSIRRGGDIVVSVSMLQLYHDCERKFYYERCTDIPRKTDYARLCGTQVHRFIVLLHKKPKEPRPFYYVNLTAARKAWVYRWYKALEQNADRLIKKDEERAAEYTKVGVICVAQYWNANIDEPPPLAIEESYTVPFMPGVKITGTFDQRRPVSLEWIASHRPELVVGGQLKEGFSPVVIVDFKTNKYDYSYGFEESDLMEQARTQYPLHEGIQPTMYTWMHEQIFGTKPIGFVWWHLRSGNTYFTYREDHHYADMHDLIWDMLDNLNAESYPKRVGSRCTFCEHLVPCNEDRHFIVSRPESFEPGEVVQLVPTEVTKAKERQLKLKLKAERITRTPPPVSEAAKKQEQIVLRELPWDDPAQRVIVSTRPQQ